MSSRATPQGENQQCFSVAIKSTPNIIATDDDGSWLTFMSWTMSELIFHSSPFRPRKMPPNSQHIRIGKSPHHPSFFLTLREWAAFPFDLHKCISRSPHFPLWSTPEFNEMLWNGRPRCFDVVAPSAAIFDDVPHLFGKWWSRTWATSRLDRRL